MPSRPTASSSSVVTSQQQHDSGAPQNTAVTLRLRGEPRSQRRGIRWAEDVVDNEGMGKKRSKVCCIYHPPEDGDHASSDDSSSSDSSSSSEFDADAPRSSKRSRDHEGNSGKKEKPNARLRDQAQSHGQDGARVESQEMNTDPTSGTVRRTRSPNAYERIPQAKSRHIAS